MSGGKGLAIDTPAALISEVFHSLSQPLTALSCTLELALLRDENLEQLRGSVQTALENAENLRQRLLLVRALNDACDDRDLAVIELDTVLRQVAGDISALFEAAGKFFCLETDDIACLVRVDKVRLLRGLFVFVEYLLRYVLPSGGLTIQLDAEGGRQARIRFDSTSCLPVGPGSDDPAEPYSCEIELVRRTLAAAGGTMTLIRCEHERSVWLATLPLAEARVASNTQIAIDN